MRFSLPHFPFEVEIPDTWFTEADLDSFTASAPSFRSTPDATPVPLREIEPPLRARTSPNDWHGFDRKRMISILQGIATDAEIKALPLIALPELDHRLVGTPYRYRTYGYRIQDGFHRFYASVAVGFECLPATITTVPELVQLSRDLGMID
jgi:hypothetical protein